MVPGHVDIAKRVQSERKPTNDIGAYDLVLRADGLFYDRYSSMEGVRLLKEALAIDPGYALAHAKLAAHCAYSLFIGGLDIAEASRLTHAHGKAAAQFAPGDSMVHAPLGEAYALIGDHDLAAHHTERALSLNPNGFIVMAHAAEARALLGDHDAGIELINKAMQNDPYNAYGFRENKFDICFLAGRYQEALNQYVGWPDPELHMRLSKAAALAQIDRIAEAEAEVQRFEAERPEAWDTGEILRAYHRMCALPEDGERWLEGFRKAGLKI